MARGESAWQGINARKRATEMTVFISKEQAERAFHLMVDKVANAKNVNVYTIGREEMIELTIEGWAGGDNKTTCLVRSCRGLWGKPKCDISFHFDRNIMSVDITNEEYKAFYSRASLLKTTKAHAELIAIVGDYNKPKKNA